MSAPRAARLRSYDQPVLIAYVVVLVSIPSELVVGPLGAAGTPAGLVAIAMMVWWVASAAVAPRPSSPSNPVKWLLLAFALAVLVSYVAGMDRPVSTAEEVSSADRALLSLVGWCGAVLVMVDGTTTRRRLDAVLQTLAVGGGLVALLGLLQFFFGLDVAHLVRIPGLTPNGAIGELIARSSFRRVTGTTAHPIEFGVVLAALAPLAVHYGRFAEDLRVRRLSWTAAVLMAGAIPLSIARSGILGAAIALALLFFTWPASLRRRVLLATVVGAAACSVAVPGLLGTFKSLFLNAGSDPSTGGRTDDYGPVLAYLEQSPLFGRGIGTFIPSLYRTLDNAYLGLLVETGVVGLLCCVVLLVGVLVVAARIRRRSRVGQDRDLAQTLLAGVAVLAVNAATFDLFGFSMAVGVLFLLIGAVGSLHSLSAARTVPERPLSRRAVAAVCALGLGTAAVAGVTAHLARPEYHALGTAIVVPPSQPDTLKVTGAGRASTAVSVLLRVVESPENRDSLSRRGVGDFEIAVGDGSLMMGTDRTGTGGSVITVLSTGSSAPQAEDGLQLVLASMQTQLDALQREVGATGPSALSLQGISTNPAFPVRGRPSRSIGAGAVVGIVLTTCATHLLRRRRSGDGPPTPSAAAAPPRDPSPAAVPALVP
ncbi:O-antigen ligase family protein [Lapillicoccus jejuensis]|uniref:O-antigen ligase n=1 Tax=Lapillicoccus jejuensis TaxID=402171 RepID=A0A542E1F5_9MICO|nr:O-antigen ligase family protein [Lapillicoccus jejuensis]TQJ09167.1 O-antigen ligase [Lapillicoccus jejuensis]